MSNGGANTAADENPFPSGVTRRTENENRKMIYVHSLGRALQFYPDRTALARDGRLLTFRELHTRVEGIAATLTSNGFGMGDRLALLLPNGPDYIELIYACSRLGVIAVPLNTRLSNKEIDRVLEDARPHGIVRHSSLAVPGVQLNWQQVVDDNPLLTSSDRAPKVFYDPEAVLGLIYTSGTTGQPKGVMVTHGNILADVHNFNYWMRYTEGGIYLHAAPIFHIADFPSMFASPAFGASQITLPRFNAKTFCETVEREHVTHTVLVPTMINLLTQFLDARKYDLSSLQVLAYGGSPMAPQLVHRTRELLPNVKLIQVYGLSETGFLTGLQDHEHTEDKLMSCGRPCPGVDLHVTDASGKQLELAQAGELIARGANVMRGYWNNPEETAKAFRDGFFRTGDIGHLDTAGYFYILDRLKDMIVTGGENVYSGEVEAVIYEHPAVREVAVFGVPDSQWGELVMACVVVKPGATVSADDLIAFSRRSLANYKLPRRIEFSETDLPKSSTGKVLKRTLRERFWLQQQRAVS
jgi:acyl-CoA synthetase (AMP-forming)/AMP-acid ligase II